MTTQPTSTLTPEQASEQARILLNFACELNHV